MGQSAEMSLGRVVVGRANGIGRELAVGTLHVGERSVNSTLTGVWI